ncbi:hypothetical protein NZD89_06290 [Alicyclobacillus fastidiosus]|uniref:Integral membrane protein n=1 Tax=Alicyclobacillus fastidiosus TaxID=392011 RepID=A0ABY6ZJB2_9BACL|nr:hypothetical protein [Alicyclobacillus fastidiosus]WAH43020.1 hypothetical protein NZD89_06290 [Alicyclobacillus fastidiosus]
MLSVPVVSSVIALALLAVSEIVSIVTRARVPMLLVALLGYLLLLWLGVFPKNLLENSTLPTVGSLMVCPLIVHMGTLIPIKVIRRQWRAVCINLIGLVIAASLILVVVSLVLGYKTAAAGVGPAVGGTIAFLVTSTKLQQLGLTSLVALPALVLAFHSLVGMPLSANLLRRYAKKYVQTLRSGDLATGKTRNAAALGVSMGAASLPSPSQSEGATVAKSLIPKKYQTNVTSLFILFVGGALATVLGQYTGINYSLWCLVIGLVGAKVGFYQPKMLERSNAFGVAMVGLIMLILPSMDTVTVKMFVGYLPSILLIIALGIIGLLLGGYVGSKIFKWDPLKGIPVALTATFGFPGDYLICEEVSRSESGDESERQRLFDEILSPMLVGGFTSVTIASIIIASIVMSTL